MQEFDAAAANPTSKFYQEVAKAREFRTTTPPGSLVAPEVRASVLNQFPNIDNQLELLQAALAHGIALCEVSGDDAIHGKLSAVLHSNPQVVELLSEVRRDIARFVNPHSEGLLEKSSVDFAELLQIARVKIQNDPLAHSPEPLVDSILERIKNAQIELGALAHLYKLDCEAFSETRFAENIHTSFEKRKTPVDRLQKLLKDSLGPQLRAVVGSLASTKR